MSWAKVRPAPPTGWSSSGAAGGPVREGGPGRGEGMGEWWGGADEPSQRSPDTVIREPLDSSRAC
jgi:hypothetical protein